MKCMGCDKEFECGNCRHRTPNCDLATMCYCPECRKILEEVV